MRRMIRRWIGFVIMLLGLCFLSGPFVLGYFTEKEQKQMVDLFEEENGSKLPDQAEQKKQDEGTEDARSLFYKAAVEYNQEIYRDGQNGLDSKEAVEAFDLDARNYGYTENMIGTIEIPRLEVTLGLYLGADYENMSKGAAVFGKTSLPLGNKNENTSIAGHRGWRGTPVFRDIQMLQKNDPIYITTPWRTLVYRVTELEIVTPDDNSWCRIREGKSLITLMTCHPYGHNYERYIVFAELTDEERPSDDTVRMQNKASYDTNARVVTVKEADGTTHQEAVEAEKIEPDGREYGSVWSNMILFAEDKMRIVAYIAAVLVGLTGIWLVLLTWKESRQKHSDKRDIQDI